MSATDGPPPDAELVEAIAQRVAELLRAEAGAAPDPRYIDAAALAQDLGVERDWVYANARRLGAIRLGNGQRGRLRFDRELVAQRLAEGEAKPKRRPPQPTKRRKRRTRESLRPQREPPGDGVDSPQRQRRASGSTPARSPEQHHTGGRPE